MDKHTCSNCGQEQSFVGKNTNYIYCERCGSKIHSDGSVSYDGTSEGIEQMKDNQRFYDSGYSDREVYERNKRHQ